MAEGITGAVSQAGADFESIANNVSGFQDAVDNVDQSELESLAETLGMDTDEVERLLEAGSQIGSLSAGFNEAAIAADELEQETCTTFLLPNYTAMMELRTALSPKTGNKEFWE